MVSKKSKKRRTENKGKNASGVVGAGKRELTSTAKRAAAAAARANRKRAEALLELIRRKKAQIVDAFYEIGEALLELSQKKLYAALDCGSFEELLESKKLISSAQAYKLIKIVKNVPRETAVSVGQERAFALLSLTEATPEDDTVAGLVTSNAKIDGAPARNASRRVIEAATERAREEASANTPEGKRAARDAKRAATIVSKAMKSAGLKGATIEARGDRVIVTITVSAVLKASE